jgi:hypothetical protein
MKTLEENRYKKTYASDARRVAWMVNNNLSEDYESMPISMRKKWSKAQYGRERYLAKEYVKHLNSKELAEQKIRSVVRDAINEQLLNERMYSPLEALEGSIFDIMIEFKKAFEKSEHKKNKKISMILKQMFKLEGKLGDLVTDLEK